MVKAEHISKSIGKTEILHDLSFEIKENQVVGLLGPNGAGKSTLMKVLTGLWDFQNGELEVCGVHAKADKKSAILPHEVSRHIGYLPENNPLYDDMYVREYLQFMLSLTKENDVDIEDIIQEVGLNTIAHKRIRELSKGYRQRVGLAQAIMSNPELLILDEPTTGLDPNQLDEIRALIRKLGEERIVILSTHILQEVEAICNRVIILAQGEIREDTTNFDNLEELFREKTRNHE